VILKYATKPLLKLSEIFYPLFSTNSKEHDRYMWVIFAETAQS
jgi:hypothetical protein